MVSRRYFKPDILGMLEMIEDPAGFDEEKRLRFVDTYMVIMTDSLTIASLTCSIWSAVKQKISVSGVRH